MHIRIFLSSLFAMGVMASSNLQAQATIVDAPDTIFVALDTLVEGGAVEAHWDIANDSEVALELMVTRKFLDTVSPCNYPYSPTNQELLSVFAGVRLVSTMESTVLQATQPFW